jgi:hypothetical protein
MRGARPSEGSSSISRRGSAHHGARHRHHLLLAAAHGAGELRGALLQARKVVEGALQAFGTQARGQQPATEFEVLGDGHLREQLAALGDQREPAAHAGRGLAARQGGAIEQGLARARQQPRQRLQQRGLARAVGSEHDGDAGRHVEVHALDDLEAAVARGETAHGQLAWDAGHAVVSISSPR